VRAVRIDHVTVAGPDLAALEAEFRATGIEPVYGGRHSNGVTHMSVVGLGDGSYVELISTVEPGRADSPWWGRHIAGGAGPCAWAAAVDDVAAEAARVAALGVPVRGPFAMHRALPDGRTAEWDLAHLGEGEPGSLLPFVIADRTPREVRVPPPAAGAPARVLEVVIAVHEIAPAAALFRRVFGWEEPVESSDARLSARVARFEGTPVALAAPEGDGLLADRLARFGPSPCGFALGDATPSLTLGLP
jgi:hypothetical protein